MVIITEFNWRGLSEIGVMVFALLLVLALLTGGAHAVEVNTTTDNIRDGGYIVVDVPTPDPTPNSTPAVNDTFLTNTSLTSSLVNITLRDPINNNTRITQGQCVEVGGVYDISGVMGYTFTTRYNEFGYYGRYEDAFDVVDQNNTVEYIYEMPYTRKAYFNFYIDPKIFGARQGYWYQYTGVYERAANKRAFYVSDRCIKDANATTFVDNNNTPILINPHVLVTRPSGSDILLASGDPLTLMNVGTSQVWLFGDKSKVLGVQKSLNASGESVLFDAVDTRTWSGGEYDLVLENGGIDGRYDVSYEQGNRSVEVKDMLVPSLRSIPIVDITGLTPKDIESKLLDLLKVSADDMYRSYTIDVQEPTVEIDGYLELFVGNNSYLEVTGYTNKASGTPVTLYVDRNEKIGRSDKYPSMTLIVENASPGDYRTFHGYIPLYYENIAPGFHNLTVVLPSGAKTSVDFFVREEPAPHYQQPEYHKFIDGNPFIPTPPPIVITQVVTHEVVKTEYKTVVEKIPVDYVTLAKTIILTMILPAIIIGVPLTYLLTVVARAFVDRRLRKIYGKEQTGENHDH